MPAPLTDEVAAELARTWRAAWNAHDVDAITAHYAEDVVYQSPFLSSLADGAGELVGRAAVRDYVAAALERFPDLHFDEPHHVAAGARSFSMVYRSVNDLLAVETLVLDDDHLVRLALCHYCTT